MNVTELFEELDKYFEREAVTLNDPTNQQKIVTYLSNEGVRVSIDNEVHNCIFQVCCLILENELWLYFVQRTARIKILFNNQNITFNKSVTDFLTISASKPYLLSGETTDLIVTLHNGFGVPLANKSVTVSDGTSLYSGITNNNGLFILYDVEVSSNTTFTATYGTVSDSCLVEYCIFADYNDPNNYILRDNTTSNCSLENGVIKIANASNGNNACFFTLNSDAITGNFKVTYELQTSSTVALYQRLGTTRTGNNANVNGDINHTTFKNVEWILQDGTMTVKIDGTTWKTTTYSNGTYYPIFAFYFNVGEYVYIRNLRIKAL